MPRFRIVRALTLSTVCAGCGGRTVYEVRLEPQADGLRRTLTGWREDGQPDKRLSDDELRRLGTMYRERVTPPNELRQTFRDTFPRDLPADLGGWGTYRALRSPLGTAYRYYERLGGAADPDAELFNRRAAVDRLVDLVVGWFDEQLKSSPVRDVVHRFLHQEFRQDLRNVALLAVTLPLENRRAAADGDGPNRRESALVGLAAYAAEHGYFLNDDVGAAWSEFDPKDNDGVLRIVRRVLAHKCGLSPTDSERHFPFLVDARTVQASLDAYLRQTPEFRRKEEAWRARGPQSPDIPPPEPSSLLGDLVGRSFDHVIATSANEVRITLHLPGPPLATCGRYDESDKTLRWTVKLPYGRDLPTYVHATWVVADEAFQTAHFGRVLPADDELARFAELFATIPAARQAEFTAHLKSLEPGDALKGRVRDFRFSEPIDPPTRTAGERLIEFLSQAL